MKRDGRESGVRASFYGSLCYEGIRGGALSIDRKGVYYRSKVLTLPEEYRNICIYFEELERLEKGHKFVFPTVKLWLVTGKKYEFVVFGRKRFLTLCKQSGVVVS